jgi:hypothetical protein
MKDKPCPRITTGQRVVLSVIPPLIIGDLLRYVWWKTDVHFYTPGQESYSPVHLFDTMWAGPVYGLLVLAYLWWLWGDRSKGHEESS